MKYYAASKDTVIWERPGFECPGFGLPRKAVTWTSERKMVRLWTCTISAFACLYLKDLRTHLNSDHRENSAFRRTCGLPDCTRTKNTHLQIHLRNTCKPSTALFCCVHGKMFFQKWLKVVKYINLLSRKINCTLVWLKRSPLALHKGGEVWRGRGDGKITSKSYPLEMRQSFVLNPNVLVLMILTF